MESFKVFFVGALLVGLGISMPTPQSGEPLTAAVNETATLSTNPATSGDGSCHEGDEIISSDPCKPLCACQSGKIICADIQCTTDSLPLEHCWKLPLNGKCCPSYLCSTGNATGDVHYPLPVLVVPPELNLSSLPPSKAELLHRTRRPGSQ